MNFFLFFLFFSLWLSLFILFSTRVFQLFTIRFSITAIPS